MAGQPAGIRDFLATRRAKITPEQAGLPAFGGYRQWVRLCEGALRDILMPLGVDHIRIDPRPVREAARSMPESPGRAGTKRERRQASCTARPSGRGHRPQQHHPAA